jgi:hypothetical protein
MCERSLKESEKLKLRRDSSFSWKQTQEQTLGGEIPQEEENRRLEIACRESRSPADRQIAEKCEELTQAGRTKPSGYRHSAFEEVRVSRTCEIASSDFPI